MGTVMVVMEMRRRSNGSARRRGDRHIRQSGRPGRAGMERAIKRQAQPIQKIRQIVSSLTNLRLPIHAHFCAPSASQFSCDIRCAPTRRGSLTCDQKADGGAGDRTTRTTARRPRSVRFHWASMRRCFLRPQTRLTKVTSAAPTVQTDSSRAALNGPPAPRPPRLSTNYLHLARPPLHEDIIPGLHSVHDQIAVRPCLRLARCVQRPQTFRYFWALAQRGCLRVTCTHRLDRRCGLSSPSVLLCRATSSRPWVRTLSPALLRRTSVER